MVVEPLSLTTSDGEVLEAELAVPGRPATSGFVLCHPHPQYGGSMHTTVVEALFAALPGHGATCLRFNFRGVGASTGEHTGGDAERLDVEAAVAAMADRLDPGLPLVLAGWSFGGDMALSVAPPRVTSWFGIAPPLRYAQGLDAVAADPRPVLLALAERDEVRPPAEVVAETAGWTNTRVEVLPGASHFFTGGTARLVELAAGLVQA